MSSWLWAWPSPPVRPYSWLPLSRALPGPAWLPGSASVASPVAPTPPAVHLLSYPPPPVPSSPCVCAVWLSLCPHPTPPAPASSSPPATRSATLDQIALAAPPDAASESPRSFGNPVGSPLPTPETLHPQSISSASGARKTLPHSSHKSESWSSSADGTVADPALPPRIPTRLRSDPVAPPCRRRNTPGDLPATSRAGSAVTENLAQEGRRGRFFPCSETWHIQPVSFNLN